MPDVLPFVLRACRMPDMESGDKQPVGIRKDRAFATTRWSVVVSAGHGSSGDSRRALESLSYCCDSRVSALIEAAYDSDEPRMRISALFSMGRSADPRWTSIVLQELENGEAEMRFEATRACGELQVTDAVPVLG